MNLYYNCLWEKDQSEKVSNMYCRLAKDLRTRLPQSLPMSARLSKKKDLVNELQDSPTHGKD